MTDTSTTTATTAGADGAGGAMDERRARFERELQRIGHRTSQHDRKLALAGGVAMAAGVALAVVAYLASTGQSDTRDVISSGILASVGLAVVIAGGALFIRGSLTEFLRFWMLRLLYEQQRADDGGDG